jgi:hypothetical protein
MVKLMMGWHTFGGVNMSATYKQDDWMLIDSYILTRAESNDH